MRRLPSIVFFGSSGHAQSLRDGLRRARTLEPLFEVVAFIDDFRGDTGIELDGTPVISFATWRSRLRDIPCLITVADPTVRRAIVQRISDAGGHFAAAYDPDDVGFEVTVGEGTFVTPGLQCGRRTVVGKHAQLFAFTTVPPATVIGNYATLCPWVTLAGPIVIEDDTFIGAGAKIRNAGDAPLVIGRGAKIAAGAVIRASVGADVRVYGDPAREVRGMHFSSPGHGRPT